jgi:LmbE family N-acetylglucosaminyl deacetylase
MSVGRIARKAMFLSGLPKFKTFYKDTAQEPHRPDHLYYFMQTYTFDPSFIVDISDTFETKMKAINAYGSQFYNPNSKEPETFISKPGFIKFLESRAQFYGFKIRKDYGEPFFSDEDIEFDIIQKLKK